MLFKRKKKAWKLVSYAAFKAFGENNYAKFSLLQCCCHFSRPGAAVLSVGHIDHFSLSLILKEVLNGCNYCIPFPDPS